MLSEQDFKATLRRLRDDYRRDNGWVQRWADWDDDEKMGRFIDCAYALYQATASNALKLTVLGGTEIRMDESLIASFGVTGVNGIQDSKTKAVIWKEVTRRILWAEDVNDKFRKMARTPSERQVRNAMPSPVVRTGSILSERGWTPILNDALIVGAVTARQSFDVGLTAGERATWQRLNGDKVTKFAARTVAFDPSEAKAAWQEFMASRKKMFFDRAVPRVFTREVLGLSFFGYEPEFSWHGLRFRPGPTRARPDFGDYLRKLRAAGFGHPTDKKKVLEAVSKFLFGEEDALTRSSRPA